MSDGQRTDEDVMTLIRDQHDQVRDLFARVSEAPETREEDFQCLIRLLAVHETAEEEIVHPRIRRIEGGEEVVSSRLEEESKAKRLLTDLEKAGVDSPDFESRLEEVRSAVEDHASSEEHDELPLLDRIDDPHERQLMAKEFKVAEAMAPTHPHPHGPESKVGNLLVGPFVSVADRVRDAIKGGR